MMAVGPRKGVLMKIAQALASIFVSFVVAVCAVRVARPDPAPQQVPTVPGAIAYNVKNFGAVCDGVTDDTAAIQQTYNAAGSAMGRKGGAGVVYFPPSTGYCKVSSLRTPSMGYDKGWLVSVFDNGLYANSIYPGDNNAFIGRTSNFAGLGNAFLWGPNAEWQQPKGTIGPLVDINGGDQIYFEGINFAATQPVAIHMHDNNGRGVVNTTFNRCSVIGDFNIDASKPTNAVGFGLHIYDSSLGRLHIQNFGFITIRGGFLHSITISEGGSGGGDLEVDNVLSEGLRNEDFLTVDTTPGQTSDITLRRVALADTVGSVYMLKHINKTNINYLVNVKFDMIPAGNTGSGLIDPASAPNLLSVTCEGNGCQYVLQQAKSALYQFTGFYPKGGLVAYGSRYVPDPLVVTH